MESRISLAAPLVVVFGATGYVGSNLVPRLLADGARVRAVGRQRRVLEAREWAGVEIVEADALDPSTLDTALAGASSAYYLVHSMAAGRDFGRLDREAAANFAQAAARCGVKRIVYLGGLVPEGRGLGAPGVAQGERRHPAGRTGAGDGDPRRHHRRPGLGGVRSDARPRVPPAGDGHAQVGPVAFVADRAAEPARVPGARGGPARGGGRRLRRRRARTP